jgi:DNA-binding MarR family transcriptional regulator
LVTTTQEGDEAMARTLGDGEKGRMAPQKRLSLQPTNGAQPATSALFNGIRGLVAAAQSYDLPSWHSRGLTLSQLRILRYLADRRGATVGQVAAHLNALPSAASGILDRLARAGLIRRHNGMPDRRLVAVELTPKGESAIAGEAPVAAAVGQTLAQLPPNEVRAAVSVLTNVTGALQAQPQPD